MKKKDEAKTTSGTSDVTAGDVGKITAAAFEEMTTSSLADSLMTVASSKDIGAYTGIYTTIGTGDWYTEHPEYTTPSWASSWTSWGVSGGDERDPGDPVPVETKKSAPTIPAYADGFMPHLVRAKEEGLRKGIEMDTVVIDRGVAVSCGLGHVDMVLGLKVKYAKEGVLPMDSAFVIYKEKDGKKDSRREIFEKGTAGVADDGLKKRFLSIPQNGKLEGYKLVAADRIISLEDKWIIAPALGGELVWSRLEITYDDGGGQACISVNDKKDAAYVRDQIGLETPEDAKPEEE